MIAMKFSKKILLLSMVFIISIIISINLNTQQVTSYRGINPIIIFDVAHQQTFNHTQMQSAIQLIEQEFDAEVFINYDNFTYTNLFGADLVIIPAPFIYAKNVGTNSPFTTIEDRAIVEYYQDGGSVLFLANPYFFEDNLENYSSNLRNLNLFMGELGHETEDYSSLALADQNGILMNDYSYRYNDPRFIYIDNTTMDTEHPIIIGGNAEKTVNELLTCSYFSPKDYADRIINTSLTTYDLDLTGKVLSGGNYRTILLADEKFEGRGISCASMLMFSDLKIVENDTITWFEAYDNALLWENMIAWLLKDIPEPERIYPITEFGFFCFRNDCYILYFSCFWFHSIYNWS